MKLALRLTFDGMVRAMRLKLLTVGEDHEEAHLRATRGNEKALTLLSEESRRHRLEDGDGFGR